MRTETLTPVFLEGGKGSLFCLFGSKHDDGSSSEKLNQSELNRETHCDDRHRIVLFLPPFGEELNLCRRFYSGVRARLTQCDMVTVQPDLYGTGDSAGLLEDATWEIWQADLCCIIEHIASSYSAEPQSIELSVLAVRAGCLMIPDIVQICEQNTKSLTLQNLVMVQPEHEGEDVVNRLFRAQTIAQRLMGDTSQSTKDLWTLIEHGHTVHAGGHSLSAELCQSMVDHSLNGLLNSHAGASRTWFDLSTRAAANNDVADVVNSWDIEVYAHTPFWQSYDLEADASFIEAVVSAIAR